MEISANAAALLETWDANDEAAEWMPGDRRALADASALRLLFLELLLRDTARAAHADLYHTCIRLGGTLAERGGSPTLAAVALDGARAAAQAAVTLDDATWRAARAALVEGYVRFTREEAERASFASWEPPKCFVVVEPGFAAVTACHPSGEPDVITPWAGRVAAALLVRGVRRAIVAGDGRAAAAVLQAVTDSGIAATQAPAVERAERKRT